MPRFVPKRSEQILKQMIAKVVSRTDLSDLADSSAVKHVLAAAARQDDEQYYQMVLLQALFSIDKAAGSDLDDRAADYNPAVITRNAAAFANGEVIFSRNGTTGTTSIPIGTLIKTTSGIQFQTTEAGSITPTSPEQISGNGVGRDSAPVAIVAIVAGASGNVITGTITAFETRPAGVDQVTNLVPTEKGADEESDSAFRARIKAYVQSLARSPALAIESALQNQQDPATNAIIQTVNVIEDVSFPGLFTVYVDDGFGTAATTEQILSENVTAGLAGPPPDSAVGGEERLRLDNIAINENQPFILSSSTRGALTQDVDFTLNPRDGQLKFTPVLVAGEVITATYTRYTGLIEFAQRLVTGDRNDRETYPGLEAAGSFGQVLAPQVVLQNVNVTLTISEGFDPTTVQTNVGEAIKDYINNLGISDDVIRAELIAAIMNTDGVFNVTVNTPTGDVAVSDEQLARTSDSNVVVT